MKLLPIKNNVKYGVVRFDSKVDHTEEISKTSAFSPFVGDKAVKLNSFNFNKPLIIRRNIISHNS